MKNYDSYDRLVHEVVAGWPAAAGFCPERDGVDYAGVLAWRLLSAVSRSVRIEQQLFDNTAELAILETLQQAGYRHAWFIPEPATLWDDLMARARLRSGRSSKKVVFSPMLIRQPRLLERLARQERWQFLCNSSTPGFPFPAYFPEENAAWCSELFQAVLRGLERQGIRLLDADRALLQQDIVLSDRQIRLSRRQLQAIRPDLLMISVEDGCYSRYFLEVARSLAIPSFLMQHALDCEPFIYDHSRCDYGALWGPARLKRYVTPPRMARITGNPQFDGRTAEPIRWNPAGDTLLLVLRPNCADKLYHPSRSPAVGLQLLEVLCRFLVNHPDETLRIKLHPDSVTGPFEALIERYAVGRRCRICANTEPLDAQLRSAKAVLSEDSSAALDAMWAGKPLIFAHFMPCTPTLPLLAYGAALDGSGEEPLLAALQALRSGIYDAVAMAEGQRRFVADFAGPLDGRAGERVAEFVSEVLHG